MMNENFDISILKETGHTSDIIQVLYQRKIQWAIDTDLIGWSSDNDNGGFHHLLVLQSCDNAHLEIKASLTFWIEFQVEIHFFNLSPYKKHLFYMLNIMRYLSQ